MDDLDLLKKDWKKQEENLPKLSYKELYKLIWKRSSSIVKWIFIISIIEFALSVLMNFAIADKEYWQNMETYNLTEFTIAVYVISTLITFYFIFQFYRNYKKINSTDSASILMKNILKTRKTVKYYISYVLISSALVFLGTIFIMLRTHAVTAESGAKDMSFDTSQWAIFIVGTLLILSIVLGIVWLIYRLVYGILLRRLNRNYKELKQLDME